MNIQITIFIFYLGNHTHQTFGYHRECYPSYTHKKDPQRFQTNFQIKWKLEAADFQSTPRKGSRVPDVASKIISANSVYFLKINALEMLFLFLLPNFSRISRNWEQKYNLQTVERTIQSAICCYKRKFF